MSLEIAVVTAMILLLGALILFLSIRGGENREGPPAVSPRQKQCPLCGAGLLAGERVHSVLFPGTPQGWMRIYGCPCCFETPGGKRGKADLLPRRCPCCGGSLPPGGYLMAAVYQNTGKKPHVQVKGCSLCKPSRG